MRSLYIYDTEIIVVYVLVVKSIFLCDGGSIWNYIIFEELKGI